MYCVPLFPTLISQLQTLFAHGVGIDTQQKDTLFQCYCLRKQQHLTNTTLNVTQNTIY